MFGRSMLSLNGECMSYYKAFRSGEFAENE